MSVTSNKAAADFSGIPKTPYADRASPMDSVEDPAILR
jgi:hypothetical protein